MIVCDVGSLLALFSLVAASAAGDELLDHALPGSGLRKGVSVTCDSASLLR